MPRNGSGTYSLPAGNPVVSGTTIQSTWANSTLTDVGDALTGSVARDGTGGMSGALRLADGTVAIPGLAFTAETTTGFSRPTTNALVASVSAIERLRINASGASVTGTLGVTGAVTFSSTLGVTGDVAVNTNKFNVTAASGNTLVAGTLGVTGAITATGGISGAVTSSSATITGGTIDGTAIGGTTAAAGSFTTLGYTSTLTGGTGVVNIGSGQIYKDASGNVGIGTSSPAFRFVSLGGAIQLSGSTTAAAGLRVQTAAGLASLTGINHDNNAFNDIAFATGASPNVYINTSGNVGVATTSPTEKLDVNGTVRATLFSGSGASLTNLPDPPIGYGQTWQDVTGSRAFGVTYTNTTGRPIFVIVTGTTPSSANGAFTLTVDGVVVATNGIVGNGGNSGQHRLPTSAIVPPGSSYSAAQSVATSTLDTWVELR
jgi:hypothetical protein